MRFALRRLGASIACNMVALLAAAWLVAEVHVDRPLSAVAAGAVLGVINVSVGPLVGRAALPLAVLTFGVALFFVNMLMLLLTHAFVSGFELSGFGGLARATVVVWLVNVAIHLAIRPPRRPGTEPAQGRT